MGFASLFLLLDIISAFKFGEQNFVPLRTVWANCLCLRDTLSLQINVHKWNTKWIHTSLFTAVCSCIFSGSKRNGLFAVSRNSSCRGGVVAGRGRLQATSEGGVSPAETLPSASFKKKSEKTCYFILICQKVCVYWNSSHCCERCFYIAFILWQIIIKKCWKSSEVLIFCACCYGTQKSWLLVYHVGFSGALVWQLYHLYMIMHSGRNLSGQTNDFDKLSIFD